MLLDQFIKNNIVSFYNHNKSRVFQKKINKIAKHLKVKNKKFDKIKLSDYKQKWKELSSKVNPLWYKVYSSVLEKEYAEFIPEDIYYTIVEPCLNNKQLHKAYSDKNAYSFLYNKNLFPKTLLRNIDGIFYSEEYIKIHALETELENLLSRFDRLIVKPSLDTGGGKEVDLFVKSKNGFYNSKKQSLKKKWLLNKNFTNYIIQPFINQHSFLKQFNEDSVNTIRVFTYRSVLNDEIIPLHFLLRVGRKGSHVDNQASGGLSCGINNNGKLNSFAIDKYGNKYDNINKVILKQSLTIPYFDKIISLVKQVASKNIYARILGFDIYINNQNEIKVIEINNINNEINFYQMNLGPLFGEYTEEIISYCKKSPKSFVLDFNFK